MRHNLGEDPFRHLETLFLQTTGLTEVPAFTEAELGYLKLKLLETSVVLEGKGLGQPHQLAGQTWLLERSLNEKNLLKKKSVSP